jgi:hypothetical protein
MISKKPLLCIIIICGFATLGNVAYPGWILHYPFLDEVREEEREGTAHTPTSEISSLEAEDWDLTHFLPAFSDTKFAVGVNEIEAPRAIKAPVAPSQPQTPVVSTDRPVAVQTPNKTQSGLTRQPTSGANPFREQRSNIRLKEMPSSFKLREEHLRPTTGEVKKTGTVENLFGQSWYPVRSVFRDNGYSIPEPALIALGDRIETMSATPAEEGAAERITLDEVWEVFYNADVRPIFYQSTRRATDRYLAVGQTFSGRRLAITFVRRPTDAAYITTVQHTE